MSGLSPEVQKKVQECFSRQLFDSKLEEHLERDRNTRELLRHVEEYDESLITSRGKRVRAFLPLIMAQGSDIDLTREQLHHLFVPVEAVHGVSLIMDDVIDRDEVRRGMKTSHVKFLEHNLTRRQANSIASLDAFHLQSVAERIPFQMKFLDPETRIEVSSIIGESIKRLSRGQILDVAGEQLPGKRKMLSNGSSDLDFLKFYREVTRNKTAPLFESGPMILEKVSGQEYRNLKKYSIQLALVYQIRDDLIDIIGVEKAEEQKDQYSDLEDGTVTLPIFYALKELEKESSTLKKEEIPCQRDLTDDGKYLLDILKKDEIGKEEKERAGSIIRETGALEKSNLKAKENARKASEHLSNSNLKEAQISVLDEIVNFALERTN